MLPKQNKIVFFCSLLTDIVCVAFLLNSLLLTYFPLAGIDIVGPQTTERASQITCSLDKIYTNTFYSDTFNMTLLNLCSF